jgi:hypothetical protein
MAEVVVFDIDAQSAIQKLAELRASTAELKKAQAELAKEVKDGNAEAAKSYEANAIILKNVANEQRVLSRAVEGYSQVQKNNTNTINFANNSIQQNRDLLKQLTAQYINLKNPPKEATEQIKRLSDTLKSQEEAIGDTRRNVGNYKDALEGLPGGLGKAIGGIRGFNAALTANPIGAVVQLVTFLTTAFQKNAVIADQVTFAFDALNKGFQFIIDTVVNTVSSFDNLQKAITNPIKFIKELATGTAQAAKDGFNASKAFDEFTVTQAKLNQQIQINEKRVEALTKSLKDRTKSEKERIAIANEAADLEIAGFKIKEDLAKQELANEQLKLKGKKLSAEEEAKIIELQTKVFVAGEEQKTTAAQRQTRINILLQKEQVAADKAAKEELKKAEFDLQKFYETIRSEEFKKTIQNLKTYYKSEQLTIKENFANGLITREEYEAQTKQLQIDSLSAQITAFEDYAETTTDLQIELNDANLNLQIENNDKKIAEEKRLKEEILSLDQQLLDAETQLQTARIDLSRAVFQTIGQFASEGSALAKILLVADKAAAIAQIIITTQKANAAARANVAIYPPFVPNPFGIPVPSVAFLKALALSQSLVTANNIQAAISIGVIGAQTIKDVALPKKAEGGEISIDGKSHAQGGEVVTVGGRAVAEVEGGEGLYVMKKNAYQKIKQFSAINEAFGGKSWLNGSSKFLADGGAINTTLPILESRGRVNNTIEQNRILSEALRQLPAPVLSIKEFEKKQAVKDKSVRIAEL